MQEAEKRKSTGCEGVRNISGESLENREDADREETDREGTELMGNGTYSTYTDAIFFSLGARVWRWSRQRYWTGTECILDYGFFPSVL